MDTTHKTTQPAPILPPRDESDGAPELRLLDAALVRTWTYLAVLVLSLASVIAYATTYAEM